MRASPFLLRGGFGGNWVPGVVLGTRFRSIFALLGVYFGRSVFDTYFLLHWLHFGVIWVSFLVRFGSLWGSRWDLWKLMPLLHESMLFEVLEGPSSVLLRALFRVLLLGGSLCGFLSILCLSWSSLGSPWGLHLVTISDPGKVWA